MKEKFGGEYNSWRYAKDAKVDCTEKAGQWVCVRTAKPCKDLLSRALGGAKEAVKDVVKGLQGGVRCSSYGAKKKDQKAALIRGRDRLGDRRAQEARQGMGAFGRTPPRRTSTVTTSSGGIQCIAVGTACK